jgi:hypothetical protein
MQTANQTSTADLTETFFNARQAIVDAWAAAHDAGCSVETRALLCDAFTLVSDAQKLVESRG